MSNIERDIDKVREYFDKNRYGTYTADDIFEYTGVKSSTARRYCNRLVETKYLRKENKGHFTFNDDLTVDEVNEELKEIPTRLHGLLIIAEKKSGTIKEGGPIFGTNVSRNPKKIENKADEINLGFTLDQFMIIPIDISNMRTVKKEWHNRKLTIQIEKTFASTIIINLGMSNEPISELNFNGFIEYLAGLFEPIIQEYNWFLSGYAIGKDSDRLWIRGAKEITLQSVQDCIQRWYNKKEIGKCRRETHCKVRLPFTPGEAVSNLYGQLPLGAVSLVNKTDDLAKALDKIHNQYNEERVKIKTLTDEIIQLKGAIDRLTESQGIAVEKSILFKFDK